VRAAYFSLIDGHLYNMGPDEILMRCVMEVEIPLILEESHEGIAGGHYVGKETVQKVLRDGLWWPSLHGDDKDYYRACDVFQRVGKLSIRDGMPLALELTSQAFEKWAIDFVGTINPPGKCTGARYIITTTEYLTRWVKERVVKTTTVRFIFDDIITSFGCPKILMSDKDTHFINKTIEALNQEFAVHHQKSTPYHPQENGMVEDFNKISETILTNICSMNRDD
jgi:hypothetical protein